MKRLLLPILVVLLSLIHQGASAQEGVCWKPSYGRGAGIVPDTCPAGQERIGLLCYANCPSGMRRSGFDCHSVCPAGLRDDGLFCRAAEYGRGGGYPWQAGDHAIVWDAAWWNGMYARCEAAHGRGNCEANGSIVYPKCAAGYEAVGCCICRPRQPNCAALGLGSQLDLSCAKKVQIGEPKPGTCGGGQEYQAGLCYQSCSGSSYGVGPVCWGQCPAAHPVDCGAMCGETSEACAVAITEQVVGALQVVADIALTVATAGTATVATAGANVARTAAEASGKTIIKQAVKSTASSVTKAQIKQEIRDIAKEAGQAIAENQLEQLANAATGQEFDFTSLDPTGIASMIKNFVLPMCGAPTAPPATGTSRNLTVLDPVFYLAKYPDLKAAFGSDLRAAQNHWLTYGVGEGRDASAVFSIGGYLARYPDLQKAFGTDYAAALNHWFTSGANEKRDPKAAGTYMSDPRAAPLDPIWYANKYPDLMRAYGYKVPQLVSHWLIYGIGEGRLPNATAVR